jgi:hypothetical protein
MGAFTGLTAPVIALTVELAAIVIIMSLLFLMYCCISQLFAIRFAFISSSRVIPPLTAAATKIDTPPVKNAAIGIIATDEFFASCRASTVLMLFLHSTVSLGEGWLYMLLATSLERVSHPVTLVRIKKINTTFIDFSTIKLPQHKNLPFFRGLLNG